MKKRARIYGELSRAAYINFFLEKKGENYFQNSLIGWYGLELFGETGNICLQYFPNKPKTHIKISMNQAISCVHYLLPRNFRVLTLPVCRKVPRSLPHDFKTSDNRTLKNGVLKQSIVREILRDSQKKIRLVTYVMKVDSVVTQRDVMLHTILPHSSHQAGCTG